MTKPPTPPDSQESLWGEIARMEAEVVDPEEQATSLYKIDKIQELRKQAAEAKKRRAKKREEKVAAEGAKASPAPSAPTVSETRETDGLPRLLQDDDDEDDSTAVIKNEAVKQAAASSAKRRAIAKAIPERRRISPTEAPTWRPSAPSSEPSPSPSRDAVGANEAMADDSAPGLAEAAEEEDAASAGDEEGMAEEPSGSEDARRVEFQAADVELEAAELEAAELEAAELEAAELEAAELEAAELEAASAELETASAELEAGPESEDDEVSYPDMFPASRELDAERSRDGDMAAPSEPAVVSQKRGAKRLGYPKLTLVLLAVLTFLVSYVILSSLKGG